MPLPLIWCIGYIMAQLIHQVLSKIFPTSEMAAYEIAVLKAQLEIPKGVIHVISDIHGEARKLRHVINNASGRLRPAVEKLFKDSISSEELDEFIRLLYYPTEMLQLKSEHFADDDDSRYTWALNTLQRQFAVVRMLAYTTRRKDTKHLVPKEFRELFEVLLNFPAGGHHEAFLHTQIRELVARRIDFMAIRAAARLIRNLSVEELVVAGDLGDRGARIDWVCDYLIKQPRVSIVWGNHDVLWQGACLGQEALIATVLRVSLRYRRMFQLEEGYGILTKALEILAETEYADDPAEHFTPKRGGDRPEILIARMQKAIAIIQFKLEGQLVERHPEWDMDARNILKQIDFKNGTVEIEGVTHQLRDTHFPTIDPDNPNELSEEERKCMDRLLKSFTSSSRLWDQMSWLTERGKMAIVRDKACIFHACIPVENDGSYQEITIDNEKVSGTKMFSSFDRVIKRAFRKGSNAQQDDKDWFYYLWAGPRSPLFGKDKMATFESYFIDEKSTHKETRNAWFKLIHDFTFTNNICKEMGVAEGGLIVNGHVPVKVEKGESPVKDGGNAVTIDGAFSEAYGDRGYTLILDAEGETLAEHHGFSDPVSIVRSGEDIIPKMMPLREYTSPRLVKNTEQGIKIKHQIEALEGLINAYADGSIGEW